MRSVESAECGKWGVVFSDNLMIYSAIHDNINIS